MKIVEKIRDGAIGATAPTRQLRVHKAAMTSEEDEQAVLLRQLRRATERNSRAFDEGFEAAVVMVQNGADLEQLRAASGAVAIEWSDTAPIEIVAHDTFVDGTPLPDD